MTSAHVPDNAEIPPPSIEEVGEGIFGYMQLDGSWGLNNAGFIVGSESVLVIDTCFTERRSRWFREAVEKTASGPAFLLFVRHGRTPDPLLSKPPQAGPIVQTKRYDPMLVPSSVYFPAAHRDGVARRPPAAARGRRRACRAR